MISKKVLMVLLVGMFMLSFAAADYKFENTAGTELMHIYSSNGNMTVSGNVSAPYFVGDGSYLTNIDAGAIDLSAYYTQVAANGTFIMQSEEGDLNVNSSGYWDGLDSPADIDGSAINNDFSWVNYTALSQLSNDLGIGNWTFDKPNYYNTTITYTKTEVDNIVAVGTVNSTNYWDGLNTPADILASAINNDVNWVQLNELVSLVGNWTLDKSGYYTSGEVDTEIGNANTSMKNYVDAQDVVFNDSIKDYVDGAVSGGSVNSANLWDALDTPADIDGSLINNDLGWINHTALSQFSNDLGIGNWTLDKGNYYTSAQVDTEIGTANTSMKDYVDGLVAGDVGNADTVDNYDASFFMPLNTSVVGDFDFNGGWTNSGVSIVGGNVYAQSGYFYDINSLQVTNLEVNGSLVPETGFDATFDIGSTSLRWRDAWFGRNVNVSGVVTAGSFVGDGSGLTNLDIAALDLSNYYTKAETGTEIGNANTSMKSYVDAQDTYFNGTMKSYVDSKISSDLTPYVQWTNLWSQVYNESEVDAINTSMKNYVDGAFYLKSNPNAYYNVTTLPAAAAEADPYWTGNFTNGLSGNLNLNGNYLSGDGGNEGVYVEADGDVGIGNAAPTVGYKLEVTGDAKVTGTMNIGGTTITTDGSGNVDVW